MTRRTQNKPGSGMLMLAAAAGAAITLAGGTMLGLSNTTVQDGTHAASADARAATIVRVAGTGSVEVDPNRFSVTLGVRARAATAGEAQGQVNEAMAGVIEAVRGLEIEGELLTTGRVSLSPIYEQRPRNASRDGVNEPPKIIGYDASNTVAVRGDEIDRVGQVIDVGIEGGANQAYGVSFMLQNRERAELDALSEAVRVARAKADVIAEAMGRRVEVVLEVSESRAAATARLQGGGGQSPFASRMEAAAPTPVEGGKLGVSADVVLTVRLAD